MPMTPEISARSHLYLIKNCYTKNVLLFLLAALAFGFRKSNSLTKRVWSIHVKNNYKADSSDNIWYKKYLAVDKRLGDKFYRSPDADILCWKEGYLLSSYITMYNITKDQSWLTKITTHFDVMMNNTTLRNGFKEWTVLETYTQQQFTSTVGDGGICYPIACFIRTVKQDPSLANFNAKANTYLNFIETEIIPKWKSPTSSVGNCWEQTGPGVGYFKRPAAMAAASPYGSANSPLPYNQMGIYAAMLFVINDVDPHPDYFNTAKSIAQYFKQNLEVKDDAYTWLYWNIPAKYHTEDASHGNLDLELAIEASNRGVVFTCGDMKKFINTYLNKIWNGSVIQPKIFTKVDGTGEDNRKPLALNGWTQLAQFDSRAWAVTSNMYKNVSDSTLGVATSFTLALIMAWNPVNIQNNGFEYKSCNDETLPASWTRIGRFANTAALDTQTNHVGKGCVKIKGLANGMWTGIFQKWENWQPNTTYQLTFDLKTSGAKGARVFIYNGTTATPYGNTQNYYGNTSWASKTITFTTPATANPNLYLYLECGDINTTNTTYFDNVKIKKLGDTF